MAGSGSEDRVPRVQSVDRAMMLLRAVASAAPEDSTAARLAETCGLNRATSWRILHTLEAHDVVSWSQETGRWSVGDAVADIAQSAGTDNIIALARPRLERLSLQTGETAALAVWRQGALTYVEEVGPPAIVVGDLAGTDGAVARHLDGQGAAGLRRRPAVPRRARRGLERFTETTITTLAALDEQLAQVRLRGYATCRGEYEASAWGVSAPSWTDRAGWSPYSASGVPARG